MVRTARMAGLALCLTGVFLSGGCNDETPADVLTDPGTMPRVIFTLPGNGSQGPYALFDPGSEHSGMPHFVVRFNKLIRKSSIGYFSVRASGFGRPVSVYLDVDYYYRDYWPKSSRTGAGAEASQYDDVLAFSVRDSAGSSGTSVYDVGQVITVTLDSTIEDINGNHLQPFAFSYTPEPKFRVTSSRPSDGATDVGLQDNLLVYFNTRCDGDILSHITVSPAIEGVWRFPQYANDSTSVVLSPWRTFPFGAPYVLTVDPAARDRRGNALGEAYEARFVTRTFRVMTAGPQGGGISLYRSIYVYLSGELDTGTIRAAFSITPATEGAFNIAGRTSSINFTPGLGFAPQTVYTVGVSTALRERGGAAFDGPYSFSFATDAFRVVSTSPGEYSGVNRGITIRVGFNGMIDTATAAGALTISPAVLGVVEADPAGEVTFDPLQSLDANTAYTVTVGTSLRTMTGHNLLQPYTWSFTTEE